MIKYASGGPTGYYSALRRGDLTHWGQKHGREGGTYLTDTAPHVSVTSHGARVASQHCSILQAGNDDISMVL